MSQSAGMYGVAWCVALMWVAPEVLRACEGHVRDYSLYGSRDADVYSFGVIMQEIATSDEPYFAFDLDLTGLSGRMPRRRYCCASMHCHAST